MRFFLNIELFQVRRTSAITIVIKGMNATGRTTAAPGTARSFLSHGRCSVVSGSQVVPHLKPIATVIAHTVLFLGLQLA